MIDRLQATLLLIFNVFFPDKNAGSSIIPTAYGLIRVPPEAHGRVLRELDLNHRPDGRLEILFEGTLAPAAPFLLYHLKRKGYSDGKAVVTPAGVMVTARR